MLQCVKLMKCICVADDNPGVKYDQVRDIEIPLTISRWDFSWLHWQLPGVYQIDLWDIYLFIMHLSDIFLRYRCLSEKTFEIYSSLSDRFVIYITLYQVFIRELYEIYNCRTGVSQIYLCDILFFFNILMLTIADRHIIHLFI